jgi:hypothetical protein
MSTTPRTWVRLAAACALSAGALVGGDALAIISHHGRECKSTFSSNLDFFFSSGASYNGSSGTGGIVGCPLSLGTQPDGCVPVNNVVIRYEDNSTSQPFYCWIEQLGFDGLILYIGPNRYTCAQAGGCSAQTSSSVGKGFIRMFPTGSATNNCIDQQYTVACFIPRPEQGNSWVYAYYAQ